MEVEVYPSSNNYRKSINRVTRKWIQRKTGLKNRVRLTSDSPRRRGRRSSTAGRCVPPESSTSERSSLADESPAIPLCDFSSE